MNVYCNFHLRRNIYFKSKESILNPCREKLKFFIYGLDMGYPDSTHTIHVSTHISLPGCVWLFLLNSYSLGYSKIKIGRYYELLIQNKTKITTHKQRFNKRIADTFLLLYPRSSKSCKNKTFYNNDVMTWSS